VARPTSSSSAATTGARTCSTAIIICTEWPTVWPSALPEAINTVLKKVLESPSIAYAVFSTQPAQTVLNFELHPGNTGDPVLALDTNGKVFCQVILDCHDDAPLPTPEPGTEHDPPDPETTPEKPISVTRKTRKKKYPAKKAKSSKAKSSKAKSSKKKAPARKAGRKKR
jgi:hypothetical protein